MSVAENWTEDHEYTGNVVAVVIVSMVVESRQAAVKSRVHVAVVKAAAIDDDRILGTQEIGIHNVIRVNIVVADKHHHHHRHLEGNQFSKQQKKTFF